MNNSLHFSVYILDAGTIKTAIKIYRIEYDYFRLILWLLMSDDLMFDGTGWFWTSFCF